MHVNIDPVFCILKELDNYSLAIHLASLFPLEKASTIGGTTLKICFKAEDVGAIAKKQRNNHWEDKFQGKRWIQLSFTCLS